MINKLKIKSQSYPSIEIEDGKNILIIGKNGIGKSNYLKKLLDVKSNRCSFQGIDSSLKNMMPGFICNFEDYMDFDKLFQKNRSFGIANHCKKILNHYIEEISLKNSQENLINNFKNCILNIRNNKKKWSYFRQMISNFNRDRPITKSFMQMIDDDNCHTTVALDIFNYEGPQELNENLLSDGNKVWLVVINALLSVPDNLKKIFVWDEPELYVHPETQRLIFNILSEDKNQFIITSHSPFILKQALLMKDKWIVLNMDWNGKERELKDFNDIQPKERIKILYTYGIISLFIIVEGKLDKKYLEVCFKNEPYHYEIIPIGGKDSITEAPKGFKILLQEIYSTWKIEPVFIKDQDNKDNPFEIDEEKHYHCLLSNHGHDPNLKDIEQVLIGELDKNAAVKKKVEDELRLSQDELETLDKTISPGLFNNIKKLNERDPLIFFKGSKKSIEKKILDNIDKNLRSECKKYLKALINNRKTQLCNVLTEHHPEIVKDGLKNLVNAIQLCFSINPANSHITKSVNSGTITPDNLFNEEISRG